jgi:hypothetical protein
LLKLLGVGTLLIGAFLYGFLAHMRNWPPSATLMVAYGRVYASLYTFSKNHETVRNLYYRFSLWAGGQDQQGVWVAADSPGAEARETIGQAEIERLRALGYVGAVEPAPVSAGVTVHDAKQAYQALNLYTSGHGPVALLVDMDGRVLHEWRKPFAESFPDATPPIGNKAFDTFARAHLDANGDLLVIYDGEGIAKLDKDSNVIWANHNGSHHDLAVDDDGRIWVLTRKAQVNPRVHEWRPILEDYITELAPDGSELRSLSIVEALLRSTYAPTLAGATEAGDILHTNTLKLLDEGLVTRSPFFKAGNILTAFHTISRIAIIDFDRSEVVWTLGGFARGVHNPGFLSNGDLLFLDNEGAGGFSRVIEVDPLTREVVWQYAGNERNGFVTETSGKVQRLPNGNTLITEANAGRVFEVKPDGSIVWEFFNPYHAGEKNELIAKIFDMQRLRPDFPTDWIQRRRP